jgi:hypothetical protein
MEAAGLSSRTEYELPVTQERLGEAAGLTSVHVNRMLQEIRASGLLAFHNGRVKIFDWHALASVAEFDPAYLMLDAPPHRLADTRAQPESAFAR